MRRQLLALRAFATRRVRIRTGSFIEESLALVPLVVGLLLAALVLPRSVAPEGVPPPATDFEALSATQADDDARAARTKGAPLESHIRAIGSAFRAFNAAEAASADEVTLNRARDAIARAVFETRDGDIEALKDLRAYQMVAFLAEVRRFEATGEASTEQKELGGTFIERMTKVGWVSGHKVLMPDAVRRSAFKLAWNRTTSLDRQPSLALTLDETRALYGFYFTHPHSPEADRARLEALFRSAVDPSLCERARAAEERAAAGWLLAKVGELGQVDAAYPALLGRGAALFLKHDYRGSAASYEAWLETHPEGPWTLRVQNNLRAALLESDRSIE